MKRNDFNEIKRLDTKALLEKVRVLRGELTDLFIDKNMNKLTDMKAVSKKKKEIAQILTVVKQKQLLEEFEAASAAPKESRPEADQPMAGKESDESKANTKKGGK
jgi:ribosomal protein L29